MWTYLHSSLTSRRGSNDGSVSVGGQGGRRGRYGSDSTVETTNNTYAADAASPQHRQQQQQESSRRRGSGTYHDKNEEDEADQYGEGGVVVVVVVEGERGEEGMVRVTIIFMAMGMAMVEGLVVFPAVGIKKRRLNLFPRRGSMTPFIGDDGSGSMVMGDFFDDGPKSYFYRPGNDVVRYSFFVPLL